MASPEPPRLPGESAKAYGYLLAYCRMGPTRTLAEMSRRFGRTPECFGSFHGRRWNWKERVAAYDAAVQAADERLVREERENAERLRLRRVVEAREIYWDLSRRLLAVIERMLEEAENSEKWSHGAIARFALVAESLMRAAVEPLEVGEVPSAVQGQLIAGTFRLYRNDEAEPASRAALNAEERDALSPDSAAPPDFKAAA